MKKYLVASLFAVSSLSMQQEVLAMIIPTPATQIGGIKAPVPTQSNFATISGRQLVLVGGLENGYGVYEEATTNEDTQVGTSKPNDYAKIRNYNDLSDQFSLNRATTVTLSLIVKEGHPENNPPRHNDGSPAIGDHQKENFNVFAVDVNNENEVQLAEYIGHGEDAYYLVNDFTALLDPGTWYLSFRSTDDGNGGSIDYLARLIAVPDVKVVPVPMTLALFAIGIAGLGVSRRVKQS